MATLILHHHAHFEQERWLFPLCAHALASNLKEQIDSRASLPFAHGSASHQNEMSEKGTEDYEIESFRNSEIYPLMPLLRKGILHTTGIAGYQGIRQGGQILPNVD
jgi:hypothetical protein